MMEYNNESPSPPPPHHAPTELNKTQIQAEFLKIINRSLEFFNRENALFFAEQFHSILPSSESLTAYVKCCLSSGLENQAYQFLKNESSVMFCNYIRYLFAYCCLYTKQYNEGIQQLDTFWDSEEQCSEEQISQKYYLLGHLYRKVNLEEKAADAYQQSLEIDNTLFKSFEHLCSLVPSCADSIIFKPNPKYNINENFVGAPNTSYFSSTPLHFQATSNHNHTHKHNAPLPVPFLSPILDNSVESTAEKGVTFNTPDVFDRTTHFLPPAPPRKKFQDTPNANLITPNLPPRKSKLIAFERLQTNNSFRRHRAKSESSVISSETYSFVEDDVPHSNKNKIPPPTLRKGRKVIAKTSKLERLDFDSIPQKSTKTAQMDTLDFNTPLPRSHSEPDNTSYICSLLETLGSGYQALCSYRCQEALSIFARLPSSHSRSPWVLKNCARAYFEIVEYKKASSLYQEIRSKHPYYLDGLEFYSTVLWQLKQEVELAHLAQTLAEHDRRLPQTWIALGNCFSLRKEHTNAIKAFRRAIQLDSSFAYAYTLTGHEYVVIDELEKAFQCFRIAIRLDPSHYNAWYGLGVIYYHQEMFNQAELHFRRALQINPHNLVLKIYLAMVLTSKEQHEESLTLLQEILAQEHNSSLARYKLADCLCNLGRHEEAITELKKLIQVIPNESSIYLLLGRIYSRLHCPTEAVDYLFTAADLDPKNSSSIRNLIDQISNDITSEEMEVVKDGSGEGYNEDEISNYL